MHWWLKRSSAWDKQVSLWISINACWLYFSYQLYWPYLELAYASRFPPACLLLGLKASLFPKLALNSAEALWQLANAFTHAVHAT